MAFRLNSFSSKPELRKREIEKVYFVCIWANWKTSKFNFLGSLCITLCYLICLAIPSFVYITPSLLFYLLEMHTILFSCFVLSRIFIPVYCTAVLIPTGSNWYSVCVPENISVSAFLITITCSKSTLFNWNSSTNFKNLIYSWDRDIVWCAQV